MIRKKAKAKIVETSRKAKVCPRCGTLMLGDKCLRCEMETAKKEEDGEQ